LTIDWLQIGAKHHALAPINWAAKDLALVLGKAVNITTVNLEISVGYQFRTKEEADDP
jgi:hypothetical protein